MKRTSKFRALLALVLATLLLTVCGAGTMPAKQEPPADTDGEPPLKVPEDVVEVSTVDELLAALAPNTTIILKEGTYDLSDAADYGVEDEGGAYRWELVLGGAQLDISGLSNLRLMGEGQVSILAQPRYAEVLSFVNCPGLCLDGLTLGHTKAPGGCNGGVLNLYGCDDVDVQNCRLFGCGVLGVTATECKALRLSKSVIDTCSSGAVFASGCRDVRLEDCAIRDCGQSADGPGGSLFFVDRCKGFALVNCDITGNLAQLLMNSSWSDQVALLGCLVEGNAFLYTVFQSQGHGVTVDKTAFRLAAGESYYAEDSVFAHTPDGQTLTDEDLNAMVRARAEYAGPVFRETAVQLERKELPDGRFEVHAATVDELLAAIAPNTTIQLDAGVYDLSAAEDYGGGGTDWYCWENDYDGCSVKVLGAQGLRIEGAGKGQTILMAEPRYAAVFRFQSCDDLSLSGFTAGHSEAPGFCTGNVLDFYSCWNVSVEDCGLYGCGVLGIWAVDCGVFAVRDSEIYECSSGAAELSGCTAVTFDGCSIHDCEYDQITLFACDMTWNGQYLSSGSHQFRDRAYLGPVSYD